MADATLTINEDAIRTYSRTIAKAAAKLELASLRDEAQALRAFAAERVEAARAQAAATDPALVAFAAAARATRTAA
jgi:hypothetical protein